MEKLLEQEALMEQQDPKVGISTLLSWDPGEAGGGEGTKLIHTGAWPLPSRVWHVDMFTGYFVQQPLERG